MTTRAELHPIERAMLNVLAGHDALPASEIREALSPKPGMARAYVLLERLESRKPHTRNRPSPHVAGLVIKVRLARRSIMV